MESERVLITDSLIIVKSKPGLIVIPGISLTGKGNPCAGEKISENNY